ncbi:MAG: 2-oxo acid dehydrogenase subunit E2 [Actinomycetota bacterium]|nr:2-oxo acid dehydrogenase subunit E2 [Actinomycetota bacterium]
MSQWDPSSAEPGLKGVSSIREPTRAERAIGRRTAETRATVPHLELEAEVNAGAALAVSQAHSCSFTAVLVRACALALREHPRANAAYRDGRYELYSRVNIAVTTPSEDGYLTPTLLDADAKSARALEAELTRLQARAGAGELTPPEMAGATFTVTDHGPDGVFRASPLIVAPQAAALAAGQVREVPVVRGGSVVPGHVVSLTLACDSRILFGATAARFLRGVTQQLEDGSP